MANRAIQPIAYAGAVFTWPADDSCTHPDDSCNISSSTVFVGGKVRLMIPIPWVAPISLGLALGKDRGYTFAFSYLGYPNKNHVDGAMAIGLDIPLN